MGRVDDEVKHVPGAFNDKLVGSNCESTSQERMDQAIVLTVQTLYEMITSSLLTR